MHSNAAKYLINSLLEMPEFMDRAFKDLPAGLLTSIPECDKSPIVEHAWHMRDCESELYGMRIRKVLSEDAPYLEPISVEHWPDERGYLSKPIEQATREFRSLRENLVEHLKSAPETALQRVGTRIDGRRSTAIDLVAELLEHDQDHRKRVVAILARAHAHGEASVLLRFSL
jgi:hypothetical protein